VLTVVVAAMVAGPKILVLFPVWLMGVAAWWWRTTMPSRWSMPLIFGTAVGLIALGAPGGQHIFRRAATPWLPPFYSALDYIAGTLAALALAALANASLPLPGPAAQRLVRDLAGTAFGLYLLHYPLLRFFSSVIPGPPDRALHRLCVFGLALGGSLVLAYPIERRKAVLKRGLRSGLDLMRRRSCRAVPERQGFS
jgi:peptidoglycan/LPS O-acetylase OafA/YrhL